MVKIKDVKWTYEKLSKLKGLQLLLVNKMIAELQLKVNPSIIEDVIVFGPVEPNRLMVSNVTNKIPLTGKNQKVLERIKKKGRDYLQTVKPTAKQYEGFFHLINKYLDDLGLSATVDMQTKDGKTFLIRNGKVHINQFPKLNSYPVEIK